MSEVRYFVCCYQRKIFQLSLLPSQGTQCDHVKVQSKYRLHKSLRYLARTRVIAGHLNDLCKLYLEWTLSYSVSRTHVRNMSRRTWNLSKGTVMYKPEIYRFDTIALNALAR